MEHERNHYKLKWHQGENSSAYHLEYLGEAGQVDTEQELTYYTYPKGPIDQCPGEDQIDQCLKRNQIAQTVPFPDD